MPELVDGLASLANRFLADRTGIPPLQGEVLPQQHSELVGCVVQLGTGDVTVNAQQVESRFARQLHVASELGRRGVAQRHAGGGEVGALHEHRLAVDGEHPVLQYYLAQAGEHAAGVADGLIDGDLDVDPCQFLVAEGPWPPQPRVVDVEVPIHLVEATGQRLLVLFEQLAIDSGGDPHRAAPYRCRVGRAIAGVLVCR